MPANYFREISCLEPSADVVLCFPSVISKCALIARRHLIFHGLSLIAVCTQSCWNLTAGGDFLHETESVCRHVCVCVYVRVSIGI